MKSEHMVPILGTLKIAIGPKDEIGECVKEAKPKRRDTIVSYIPPKSKLSYTIHPGITRDERDLKRDFDALGVKPHVATFMMSPPLRIAVTIASEHSIDYKMIHAVLWAHTHELLSSDERVEVCMKRLLARRGFFAVAICSRQDVFNQTRGEVIALGRLRKELMADAKRHAEETVSQWGFREL